MKMYSRSVLVWVCHGSFIDFYSNPQVSLHSLFVLLRVNSSPGVEGAMYSPSLPSPGHESQFPGFPAVCSLSPLPGLGFSSASLWSDFLSWTALKKTLVEKKNFWSMFFWLTMLIFLQCTELFFLCPFLAPLLFVFEVSISLLPSAVDEGLAPFCACYSWRCVLRESWNVELGLNLRLSCTANKWFVTKSQVLTAWWWKIMQVLSILMIFLVP